MRPTIICAACAAAMSLAATGAMAQNAIENQIQNQNRQLDQMLQNQGALRQQQFDNSSIRLRQDQDRDRVPNYPSTADPQRRR